MLFTITYRNSEGKKATLDLELPSKSQVWDELKKRGINAISIEESALKGHPKILIGRKVLSAIVFAFVLLGAGLYVAFMVGGKEEENIKNSLSISKNTTSVKDYPKKKDICIEAESAEESKSVVEKSKPELKTYRDERGILRYEGGLRVPGQRPTAKPIELGSHQPKIFRHSAEEHISWLIDMKIGEPIIGDYEYGEHFLKSFMESLKEPIEILDTDDAVTRDLKKAVEETKEDLRKRMDAGEDIVKIMNDTMNEYRRLARYKQDLQIELNKIRHDTENYTDQDVVDFTMAANELLKKNGLPPLSMPRAVMRSLRK